MEWFVDVKGVDEVFLGWNCLKIGFFFFFLTKRLVA